MIKRGSDGVITLSDMLDLVCPFPTANIILGFVYQQSTQKKKSLTLYILKQACK